MNFKLHIVLGVHGHLPNGSGEDEFEALYNTEIKPLVSTLYNFPRVNMVFHYSGVLLYWIERRHPELFMILEELLSRKQAELLGGGFYEPMMPLLAPADKVGQIEMLTTYLRKQFGKRPQGCWVPQGAWEQNLVGPLTACGMSYTFLEERYFETDSPGPCISEDQGKLITVFPVSSGLGKDIIQDEKFFEKLRGALDPGQEHLVTVFLAPGNNRGRGYQKFFEFLSGQDADIEFTTSAKIYKSLRFLDKRYFSGNSPRQILVKRPAANSLYAKTIYTHGVLNQLRGDKVRKRTALEELWKAQDSCLYGDALVSSSLRKTAYKALLEAEKIAREKGKFTPSLSIFDYDLDGEGEYLFQDEKINCYIKAEGAGIFELDYLPRAWNYLDAFAPHSGDTKIRKAFTDFLAPLGTIPESGTIPGARCCGKELFEASEIDRPHRKAVFRLSGRQDGPFGSIEIDKTWQIKKNVLSVRYSLKNSGSGQERFIFIPRLDLSFPKNDEAFLRIFALKEGIKDAVHSSAGYEDMTGLEFGDVENETVLTLESNRHFDARILHVSEGSEYQFTTVFPLLSLSLDPGKTWEGDFTLKISS
ncbi:glycosyl hydrolase [Spirochaetia bacterium]|nr:glycosyl hydrolase [Spirochaetia bacterium]